MRSLSHDPRIRITSVTLEHPGQPDRRYLYAGEIYKQPLKVDRAYLDDRLTY